MFTSAGLQQSYFPHNFDVNKENKNDFVFQLASFWAKSLRIYV